MIDPSRKEIQSHYDFITVGAGAAGSVFAAELSASGAQVLVVESGGPDDAPTVANPGIWFYNVGGLLDYHLPVTPSPRLNNRAFNVALGHGLPAALPSLFSAKTGNRMTIDTHHHILPDFFWQVR